jgi:threonine dehydrogenase-like Zn-dependent dehydrogenase
MGQAHVKRWINEILPLVSNDDDPLGTEDFASHRLPLSSAAEAYEKFQRKQDAMFKVVFEP